MIGMEMMIQRKRFKEERGRLLLLIPQRPHPLPGLRNCHIAKLVDLSSSYQVGQ